MKPLRSILAATALSLALSTHASAQLVEIGSMTVPNVVFDFDAMSAGATTLDAINAAFGGAGLAGLTFTTRAGTGTYDSQPGGGRALAANADGSGALVLIDVGGAFGNADVLAIDLVAPATEFGFEIADWAGAFNVNAFSGGAPVGSVVVSTAGDARTHFVELQGGGTFDRIELTANPQSPPANWVVPSLHVPAPADPDAALADDDEGAGTPDPTPLADTDEVVVPVD